MSQKCPRNAKTTHLNWVLNVHPLSQGLSSNFNWIKKIADQRRLELIRRDSVGPLLFKIAFKPILISSLAKVQKKILVYKRTFLTYEFKDNVSPLKLISNQFFSINQSMAFHWPGIHWTGQNNSYSLKVSLEIPKSLLNGPSVQMLVVSSVHRSMQFLLNFNNILHNTTRILDTCLGLSRWTDWRVALWSTNWGVRVNGH